MVSETNLALILTILIIGWCYLESPEGTNRLFVYINLRVSLLYIRIMRIYFKWKLLKDLNKMNRDLGLPEIPWNRDKIKD